MIEALKTLEALTSMLQLELKRVKNLPETSDKAYTSLQTAAIRAIDLGRDIQDARGWQAEHNREIEAVRKAAG